MDRSQTQADGGSPAIGAISALQDSPRSCIGTCDQCRDGARHDESAAEAFLLALPDITGRPDLVRLVDSFYIKVRTDPRLGHVFDTVAMVDWDTHLPKLYDFWDSVIFRAGTFRGNPIAVHAKLIPLTDMSWPLFERWLELFQLTVHEMFAGERAEHIIRCAQDMAGVIFSRIHGTRNPQHDPVRLPPVPQAR